jgi:Family of unknown function (DUF6188)
LAGVAGEVTPFDLVETSDRWVLPIGDESVVACCIDYAITLRFGNEVSVRIEQPFVYRTGDGVEHLIVPEGNPVRLAPALAVTRLVVRQGFAFKDGHLELRFADGSLVSVPATEDLEPWELVGPEGLRVVSVPGGDLAIWRSQMS